VVSDVGGHHFQNSMFGGGSAHQQTVTQESPAVHHGPVRPSPHTSTNPAVRLVHPQADVSMTDSGFAPNAAVSEHYGNQPGKPAHAHMPPPSPRSRPQEQQSASHTTTPNIQSSVHPSPAVSLRSPLGSSAPSPRRIKVKSLSHIQSFATEESNRSLSRRQRRDPGDVGPQYEISEMPVTDIIEMVAGLLTKITTTNDRQHEHLHRHIPPPEGTSGLSQQTTSVLAFHGKNVPSISILSYLSRIHKYCPTTYEVFLSLLVYFDRMTERVNEGPMRSLRQANQQSLERLNASNNSTHSDASSATYAERPTPQQSSMSTQAATPPPSGSLGKPAATPVRETQPPSPPQHIDPPLEADPYSLSHFFVVDSFNIHRLVIAGVTCASKFFSDVFYTNSRYAKVCHSLLSNMVVC
jgi:hypothetical protein